MRDVQFVFFDAGGGHRSAATALKTVAEQQARPWNVELLHLQDVLGSLDVIRRITGISMQDVYNRMLANGWTLGSQYLLPAMHGLIRLYHPAQVRMLARYWSSRRPDLVVSVVPNFNRAMFQGLRRVLPSTPFATIITDFADYPPHFWIERQPQYLICGTDRAVSQAREMGYPADHVFRVSGMILRPMFYAPMEYDRTTELKKLGLDPNRRTGIVLFGGQGSPHMLQIARRLGQTDLNLQLIFICGRNEKLAGELRSLGSKLPMHVVGFTQDIPYYMGLSDFFVGKPGPGSISEAIAMKLPVIIERNAWTLPQERYNTEWVLEKEVGVVIRNFDSIVSAVQEMLAPGVLERFRANAAAISNRAVFEIPEILDDIMRRGA